VRRELAHWERRASAIEHPDTRALALAKLRGEGFNAAAGAMLATLAPPAHRTDVVRAIVALEVLFDLLDGLTEKALPDPIDDGRRLFAPFVQALGASHERAAAMPLERTAASFQADAYLAELAATAGEAFAALPAAAVVADVALAAAERAAEAQIHMHAATRLGIEPLERWAQSADHGLGLDWRDWLAGSASSVLAVHALLAAAAHPQTTTAEAAAIDRAYLSICILLTLLDSLVDHARDRSEGKLGYADLYEDPGLIAQTLCDSARRATLELSGLPQPAAHIAMLTGVVAYYASAPGAREEPARQAIARLQDQLGSPLTPTLLLVRAWRLARELAPRARLSKAHTGRPDYHP